MMHKFKTTSWARLGYLACLPLMVLTLCFCTNAENSDDKRAQQTAQEVRDGTPATDSSTDTVSGMPGQDKAPVETATSSEQVYDFGAIEQKPLFNGDSANGFALWLSENLVYPQAERQAGTEGRVILAFTIGTDGRLGDIEIVRSAGSKALDDAAVAAVSKSPAWTPGMVGGKPVAVRFSMPIVFQISE
ncbi:MAG TPA: energy transducer TonB [Candidatus Cryptobacteroides pullicola]|nr:energy transducer TonB [Candidatus Cryptobacteroides pullicola]